MSTQKFDNVIVFGPTGAVGGDTALEASKRGAKVWLAMRNPAKPIDAISAEEEEKGNFARIQADLTDPTSITAAVQKSGAKAAFVYLVPTQDSLRASFKMMKDAGIEYVIFLSSFSIEPGRDLRAIPQNEFIPYQHAQVEIALEDLGITHTALRPAFFASNSFKMFLDKTQDPPKASIARGDLKVDNISEHDIGRVAGAVLVERPSTAAKEVIYLCGPELITMDQTWEVVREVTGKPIVVEHISVERWLEGLIATGVSPSMANYLAGSFQLEKADAMYPEDVYCEAVANIKKYSGREPQKFAAYVSAHKKDAETTNGSASGNFWGDQQLWK